MTEAKRVPIGSPAGLRALFPGLNGHTHKPAAKPPKLVIPTTAGFLRAAGNPKRGQRVTIAGVRVNLTKEAGYQTDCEPGQETEFIVDKHGNLTPV